MSFDIISIPHFDKQVKQLSKKFPSLKKDLQDLHSLLATNPVSGIPIGNHCYKIRISISSKGKGKSGGARVITNVYVSRKTVYLLSIYDKSEQENISDEDLQDLIDTLR